MKVSGIFWKILFFFQLPGFKNFTTIKLIGKGCFGKVYEVCSKLDGNRYAIKVIKQDDGNETILKEVKILSTLYHENIVRYQSCWIENGCLNIQMELCENGTLWEAIQKGAIGSITYVYESTRKLLEALDIVHANGIYHGDLHSGNIFITKSHQLKIGDFGISTCMGSSTYLFDDKKRKDIGALGELIEKMFRRVMKDSYGGEADRLVQWMTNAKIELRPSAKEILDSEFFNCQPIPCYKIPDNDTPIYCGKQKCPSWYKPSSDTIIVKTDCGSCRTVDPTFFLNLASGFSD